MVTKVKQTGIADLAVGQAQLAANSVTAAKIVDGAVGAAEIDAGAVGTSEIADGSIALADLSAAATPAFTKSYTSAGQTITSGGTLTLAHGLAAVPTLLQIRLKCTTGEHGYSINDEVIVAVGEQPSNRGVSVVPDATNVVIRYGSNANAFNVNDKSSGASAAITNANWQMIVRAWA